MVVHKEGFAAIQDGLEFSTLVSGAVSSSTILAQQVWGAGFDPRYYPEKKGRQLICDSVLNNDLIF